MRALAISLAVTLTTSLVTGCSGDEDDARVTCTPPTGNPIELETAKLYFEWQSTDDDTGIHGLFGAVDWAELCISAPDGTAFLFARPEGNLHEFGMSDLFFESREPAADEVSQEDVLALFPAGMWDVIGSTIEGEPFEGSALLTHDIPLPPVIAGPADGAEVDPANLVVTWEPVTETVAGDPLTITGYEVIVTNEDKDGADPHGMSHPILSAHVIPDVNSLTIPSEFFEDGTEYELEVIAIEESGNQTITVQFFDTP